jgi:hypothetical protein
MNQTTGDIFRLLADAQRDSRSGTAYVVVSALVRGERRVIVRDRATDGAVRSESDVLLALCQNGHTDFIRNAVTQEGN